MGEHIKDPVASFNTDELEVAEILGQFSDLAIQNEYGDRVPSWGCKKPRYVSPSNPPSPSPSNSSSSGHNLPINVDPPSLQPVHSKIKTKDEDQLLKSVEKLTKCRADLQKAMGNVKGYHVRLKDFNKKLKDRRAEYYNRNKNQCGE